MQSDTAGHGYDEGKPGVAEYELPMSLGENKNVGVSPDT